MSYEYSFPIKDNYKMEKIVHIFLSVAFYFSFYCGAVPTIMNSCLFLSNLFNNNLGCKSLLVILHITIPFFINSEWGLGIGDWGMGIGDWAQAPIPNPQSPIPN